MEHEASLSLQQPRINATGLSVLHDPEYVVADIIFIHGLQGHPRDTWTCQRSSVTEPGHSRETAGSPHRAFKNFFSRKHKDGSKKTHKRRTDEVFWPLDFLAKDCANARILTWGYDSKVSHFFNGSSNQSNITAHAKNLLSALRRSRLNCQSRSIIFVAHSLGGIIVKDVLRRAASDTDPTILDIYTSMEAVLFLGTPHRGSNKAGLAEVVRKVVSVSGFDTTDQNIRALQVDSTELELIHELFMNLYLQKDRHFKVLTFQEAKGVVGVSYLKLNERVVEPFSSLIATEPTQIINADHMSMCRFPGRDDEGYQQILGEIQILLSGLQKKIEQAVLEQERALSSSKKEPSIQTTASTPYSLNDVERKCVALLTQHTANAAEYMSSLPIRVEGTCQWILSHSQYRDWSSKRETCILWIIGYPGSGKILSAYLLEHLSRGELSPSSRTTLCYFFCDEKIDTQRDGLTILRSLIHQLLVRRRLLIKYVKDAYDIYGPHFDQDFNELWRIFVAIVSDKRTGPISVIIDAIDECEETTRERFLRHIMALISRSSSTGSHTPYIKFFVTSRPLLNDQHDTNLLQIDPSQDYVERDLSLVIRTKIDGIVQRTHCKPEARTYLENALYSKADRTFLWVTLVLHLLEKSFLASQKDFRRIVDELPKTLTATYESFLRRIPIEYQSLAAKLLHFLVGSSRPLTLEEMRILIAVKSDHTTLATVEEDMQPNIQATIEGVLGPLFPISSIAVSPKVDDAEYIWDPFDLEGDNLFKDSTVLEAEACAFIETKYIFFDYAARYWAEHFSLAAPISASELQSSAVLLSDGRSLQGLNWLRYYWFHAEINLPYPRDFDPMVTASYFGHLTSLKSLLHKRYPIDLDIGVFSLYWASRMGHNNAVELLLGENISPDVKVIDGQSAFIAAVSFNRLHVVKILLEDDGFIPDYNEYRVNYAAPGGRTPLSIAAGNGYIEIVEQLLRHRQVLPDVADFNHWTPPFWSVSGKHLEVLRLLVTDNRISICHVDRSGRNVLSWAASAGKLELVEYLVGLKNLKAYETDKNGRTALSWAAGNGHLETTILLRRSQRIDLSRRDKDGRNALSWACSGGHHKIVEYLIRHDRKGVDEADVDGWTPLAWALFSQAPKTVQVLLDSGIVNVNKRDASGRSALSFAAGYGYVDVVKLLLDTTGIDIQSKDNHGQTALSYAAPHPEVVRLLQRV
ncbi:ankyrin repeat-containing domain protein [Bisporella sp. PMI_857]|nr:ankyrin repeat-containing domain protein [Bisporella sp. PMI_857]KAH8600558.1 ankyrin repeat-containing domain protein [Bisporella sp. PMI_857]